MRAAVAAVALFAAGCDDLPQARSESEIRQIAREEQARHDAEIAALEQRVDALAERLDSTSNLAISTAEAHESLRKTFNGNVDQENERRAAAMTARGACGTRLVNLPSGGWYNEPIKCTVNDLR